MTTIGQRIAYYRKRANLTQEELAEHIKRIRAKLMPAGVQGQIVTVWGVGYKWVK